jgi:PAS domain S-box-containing protein
MNDAYRDMRDGDLAARENGAGDGLLRFLADMLPQLIWITDAAGYHEYFNDRWFEYTGATLEQTQGEGWTHLLHPDDLERTIETWRHSLATGEPYEIEYRFRRASDDVHRWFLGRALPMRDESGKILKWFGTCTDIHEMKRSEAMQKMHADVGAALASSEEVEASMREVARIVVASFADLFAIDLFEGNDVQRVATAHASRSKVALAAATPVPFVARATGSEAELLERVDAAMLDRLAVDDAHRDALRELFVGSILRVALVARGRTIGAITAVAEPPRRFDRKDLAAAAELAGRCAVALDSAALDRDAAIANRRYRELAEELERRVEARTIELAEANERLSGANVRLLEVDRMKDEFLGGLSTQLSAPLNAILAFVDVLGSGAIGGLRDEQLEYVGRIRASSTVLLASVDDLLDLSRLSAKRFTLERESVDVGALVARVLEDLAPIAKMQGLAVLTSLEDDLSPTEADAERLRQVIVQLVHGAIRLTSSGGFVRVTVTRADDAIRFEAFQTGAPIPATDVSKVFESVAQLGGAWIGLAVAKKLVEAHGGAIGLETAEDGNSFWFTLPIAANAAP